MQVSRRTLETLEWPLLVERLLAHARTPGGRRRCEPDAVSELFAPDAATARAWLAETSEARVLLERAAPPFGGLSEIGPALLRAERGGQLGAGDLLDIATAALAI